MIDPAEAELIPNPDAAGEVPHFTAPAGQEHPETGER